MNLNGGNQNMNNDIETLLRIENNPDIISYRFNADDFLIWPLVRYRIFSQAMDYNQYLSKRSTVKKYRLVKYIVNNFLNYPGFVRNKKILIFGTGVTNIKINNNYFNRIHDYYNLVFPDDTVFLESSDNFEYRKPRAFKNTYYYDYMKIMSVLKSKLVTHVDEKTTKAIDNFIEFLNKNFAMGFDQTFYEMIKNSLIKEATRLSYMKSYFLKLLDRIQPKIVFLEDAHYGGQSYIIKWAKERGIVTAEFQHGTVSKSDPAYNYGEGVRNSKEYKKYVPDYFLTYGEYWNNQVRIPGKTYVVGNPHFYESIRKYRDIEEQKNTILIVSQWTMTEEFVKIAEYLAKKFKNMRIIFKMHPGEMKNYELIKPLESFSNVEIRKDGDIYELIARCENIVACYSTAIFEALAFNKKRIYILENNFSRDEIPQDIGVRFNSKEELVELIEVKAVSGKHLDIRYYFSDNWKENYINFIKNELCLKIS